MSRSFENYANEFIEEESRSKGSNSNTDHMRRMYEQAETSSSRLQRQRGIEVSRGKQPEVQENDLYYSFSRATPLEQLQKELQKLVEDYCPPQDGSRLPQIGIGQQLGEYKLVRELGKGRVGEVFLGKHISSKERVAVKVLQCANQIEKQHVKSFCKEIEYMASLNHPHIVRLLGFGSKDKVPFLVMEYASHGTLKNKRLSPMRVAELVKQLAGALDYMHIEKQLVHCDIKPKNLLLRKKSKGKGSEALVGDLGLAALVETERSVGTFGYIAWEQWLGKPCPASDQYALGVVVHELLSGELPRWSDNHIGISSKITSPKIREVLARVLDKDLNKCFHNVADFSEAFEQACQEQSQQQSLERLSRYVWSCCAR
jgi:serine/threonine protein kinase